MAKSKTISKIVAGALALVVAAGSVCLLGYTTRDTNGNWFGSWTNNGLNNNIDNGDSVADNGSVITNGESNGMLLSATAIPLNSYEEYGVSPLAENAYTLSVTYTPDDTTIKDTTYTIAFENPSSTWATGKTVTDYATITQSSAGSLDAVLEILQPFGERIIVTAQSDMTPEISTSVNVDYVKGVTISTKNYYHKATSDAFETFVYYMVDAPITIVNKGVGTIDYTSAVPHCSYVMDQHIYDLLRPICQEMGILDRLRQSVECETLGDGATLENSTFMAFFDGGLTLTERKYIMAQLAKACSGMTKINLYYIYLSSVDVYYNDVLTSSTSSNMTYAYQINNLNSYLTEATALTPNVTDLIFSANGQVS